MEELGQKILADLDKVLAKDPEIDEYDFIVGTDDSSNHSPVIHEKHKFAVEAWAVKVLYGYAYRTMMELRRAVGKLHSDDKVNKMVPSLTRCVLLVNPDCMTAWNIRKELITHNVLQCQEDLKLGELILTKHPKSSETLIHRRWIIERHFKHRNISDVRASKHKDDNIDMSSLNTEMKICLSAADKYPNNYNAWSHRIWMLQQLGRKSQVLHSELNSTYKFVATHVSDYSGFHYRQYLLDSLCHCVSGTAWEELIKKEMEMITDLIHRYPDHEALWCHRRAVLSKMLESIRPIPDSSTSGAKRCKGNIQTEDLIQEERTFIEKNFQACKTLTWQHTLVSNHQKWLCRITKSSN